MVDVERFGCTPDGRAVHAYTLSSSHVTLSVMDFGATVLGITCPDAYGTADDIVLGFDELAGYLGNPACHGATIGPVANRTADAEITVAGKTWQLAANEGANNLHTDLDRGLHKRVWSATVDEAACAVTFMCTLAHGELGLPGTRTFSARYELAEDGTLTLSHRCETDRPTFVNMTNHTYFNLAGHAAGSAADQIVRTAASRYLPVRADAIPTGEVAEVAGTPFDLASQAQPLGKGLAAGDEQIHRAGGYDHCFCVDGYEPDGQPRPALCAHDPASGRMLNVAVSTPGFQLYTGNGLDDAHAKGGTSYGSHAGFAVEPEFWPDCAHHPTWPQPVCTPEHPYASTTVYRFSVVTAQTADQAPDPTQSTAYARAAGC